MRIINQSLSIKQTIQICQNVHFNAGDNDKNISIIHIYVNTNLYKWNNYIAVERTSLS